MWFSAPSKWNLLLMVWHTTLKNTLCFQFSNCILFSPWTDHWQCICCLATSILLWFTIMYEQHVSNSTHQLKWWEFVLRKMQSLIFSYPPTSSQKEFIKCKKKHTHTHLKSLYTIFGTEHIHKLPQLIISRVHREFKHVKYLRSCY